jgi:hypothetical protein
VSVKRQRWLLRFAVAIDGGLTTANKAYEELEAMRKVLEDAGYFIIDHKGVCSPMRDEDRFA